MDYVYDIEYLGQVVPVRFHTWWPNPRDSVYAYNPVENEARIYHYAGIYPWDQYLYTPSLRFDGGYYGDPSDDVQYHFETYDDWYARVRHVIDSLYVIPSPIRIDVIDCHQDPDSAYITFDLVVESAVPANLRLLVALTESLHRFTFPVGRQRNGFRAFATDPSGYPLALSMGDSVRMEWSFPVDPQYYWLDRLVINVWVENPATREVLQATRAEVPDLSGVEAGDLPGMMLGRNSPNPFSSGTTISYSLKTAGKIRLAVYSLEGRLVRVLEDGRMEGGVHSARWDGCNALGDKVASGVYYYRLETENAFRSGKMILIR
jgi:hypothetical protein